MADVTLTPAEVFDLTGVTVSTDEIALASSLIDQQTGYTPTEHQDERAVATLSVKAAWAMVAGRVHRLLTDDASGAVTSESQGDYSYAESVTLAGHYRFSNVTEGKPMELLQFSRARWAHI